LFLSGVVDLTMIYSSPFVEVHGSSASRCRQSGRDLARMEAILALHCIDSIAFLLLSRCITLQPRGRVELFFRVQHLFLIS
jgi:hypothetical protein